MPFVKPLLLGTLGEENYICNATGLIVGSIFLSVQFWRHILEVMMKNGVMMQYFEWYLPDDGSLWRKLAEDAQHLSQIGVTAVWVPPAYKAMRPGDVGYATYDLYDFGEFDQKGTVRTKYGTRQELEASIRALHDQSIKVYLDAVLNHKAGADEKETFYAKRVNEENRNEQLGDAYEIEGWTHFTFPGRAKKYSDFEWHWYHFSGIDYDARRHESSVFKIEGDGKDWSHDTDPEKGNYDYLMFANVDYKHPEVVQEITHWGEWVIREFNLDGFRMDAVKHISRDFVANFLRSVRSNFQREIYAVGECWKNDDGELDYFLDATGEQMDLFDVPLHFNLHEASQKGADFDLRTLFQGALVQTHPTLAVTFVDNHDSQAGQSLESPVADWFKPTAYAVILLQKEGYPCIFYGDYYGTRGEESIHRGVIDTLLKVRRERAYGEQWDYFDDPHVVGFVRSGDAQHANSGLVLLISNQGDGEKVMNVGRPHAGERWMEVTGCYPDEQVTIDPEGNATFRVPAGKVAVWHNVDAS